MVNVGKLLSQSDAIQATGAPSDGFWDEISKVSEVLCEKRQNHDRRVRIAMFDSGIDLRHPKVVELMQEWDESPKPRVVSKSFVSSVVDGEDTNGHGTHVAVTLMRVAPWAEIYVASVVNADGKVDPGVLAKAIYHSVDDWDVDILSMSLGFESRTEHIAYAIEHVLHKDKLVFAAVANGGSRGHGISWPAKETMVFGIFSCCFDGERSRFNPPEDDDDPFSRYKFLGEGVKSAWLGGEERRMNGTSMATPIAAGTAALFIEYIRQRKAGSEGFSKAVMTKMERCARSPVGMRALFATFGEEKARNDWLRYMAPLKLTHSSNSPLKKIDDALYRLYLGSREELQLIQDSNTSCQGETLSCQNELQQTSSTHQSNVNGMRSTVVGLLTTHAVTAGALGFIPFFGLFAAATTAVPLIWHMLSAVRENQGTMLRNVLHGAEAIKQSIAETIDTALTNIDKAEQELELLEMVVRRLRIDPPSQTEIDAFKDLYSSTKGKHEFFEEANNPRFSKSIKLFRSFSEDSSWWMEGPPSEVKQDPIETQLKQSREPLNNGNWILLNQRVQPKTAEERVLLRNHFVRSRVKLVETAVERSGEAADSIDAAAKIIVEARRIEEEAKKFQMRIEADLAEKERMEQGGKLAWLKWFLVWLGVGSSVYLLLLAGVFL